MVGWRGWLALGIFVLQNGAAALIVRYARLYGPPFNSSVAVLMQEAAIKWPICLLAFALECRGCRSMLYELRDNMVHHPREWLHLMVPAVLYTVQNNAVYYGYSNLDAAIGQVTYQTKILGTALCSVVLLGRRLSPNQWLSLLVLSVGVICAQDLDLGVKHLHAPHPHGGSGKQSASEQRPLLGIVAFLVAALCASVASVYFEMMLKKPPSRHAGCMSSAPASLWLRNLQLTTFCALLAPLPVLMRHDDRARKRGLFHGFGYYAWLCVIWQAGGGLLVAVSIKYADNILRGFAQALAIIVAACGSFIIFDTTLSARFCVGVSLVIGAVCLFGGSSQTPYELMGQLISRAHSMLNWRGTAVEKEPFF
mmetsp:Transcript_41106/g.68312  ORF Transcript_41106/g.68312 Transcript_41106/m.68312 type:complete len:366 (+) Transcript_41106:45-1142(+)